MTADVATPVDRTARRPRRRWLRILIGVPLTVVTLVLLFLAVVYGIARSNFSSVASAPVAAETTRFDGRYLIAASDADMVATAYADDAVNQVPGDEDTLSLIELPATGSDDRVIEIPVSNSVPSWPQITAVSPDGTRIYVVET